MHVVPLRGALLIAIAIGMACTRGASAQIATDGTLGPAGSLSGPNYAIGANLGRQVGSNLFHSFSIFNVATGESATFSGPNGISNVLGRVTGGSASNIDGVLRSTIPGANLFLINPKGILFGPNASLDLTGSFHATTANYVKLADGGRFDASDPDASVLTSAPPAAFGFLGTPAPITAQGSTLHLPERANLSLIGGEINVADTAISSVAGDVRLIAMGAAGEVPLDISGSSSLGTTLAPVQIEWSNLATRSGPDAAPGRITIKGGRIAVSDSALTSVNHATQAAPPIELVASGDVTTRSTTIRSYTDGAGRGADLRISGGNVTLEHNTQLRTDTVGQGAGGEMVLSGTDSVSVLAVPDDPDFTTLLSVSWGPGQAGGINANADAVLVQLGNLRTVTLGSGDAAPIRVSGRTVDVTEGAWIYSDAFPGTTGRGADIDISATERAFIGGAFGCCDSSSVFSRAFGSGDAGNIRIVASTFEMRAGLVDTYTVGTGNAGDLTFAASEITVNGGQIFNSTFAAGNAGSTRFYGDVVRFLGVNGSNAWIENGAGNFSTGNGGNIEIYATRAFELNGSGYLDDWTRMAVATQGTGRGGDIIIESPSILIERSAVFSRTRFGTGDQGGITLRANEVRLQNGGEVASGTEGDRDGSFVLIEAQSVHVGDWSRIYANTVGSGDAGRVTINAQRLTLTGASAIQSSSVGGRGNAGDIVLNIGESFEMVERTPVESNYFFAPRILEWPGGLLSQASGSGNAGTVFLRAPNILIDDGRILTTALGTGHGGRVEIQADNLVMRNGAQIDARAAVGSSGNAGSIDIVVGGRFEISGLSRIDGAFSGLYAETQGSGLGGNIGIRADTLFLDRGLIRSSTTSSGDAGTIRIRAGELIVTNGGWIDVGTSEASTGAGGNIDISATRSIVVEGVDTGAIIQPSAVDEVVPGAVGRVQGPFASTISSNTSGAGAGGDVSLSASQITIADGGRVSANSTGTGTAGSIFIVAPEWLKLANGSITTQADLSDGGNIDIRAGNMVRLQNSEISTSVGTGEGSGGNIFIDPTFVILENSRISANAFGGAGGNINIITDYFMATPDSVVDASSQLGVSGSVQIAAPRTEPGASLPRLPATFLDASSLLRDACAAHVGQRASSLVGVGRGGVAAAPDGYSGSRYFADAAYTSSLAVAAGTFGPSLPLPASKPTLLSSMCGR